MADDENKLLEEARRRPLAERVAHKLWKARVEAFEDIKSSCEKVFSEEDPILNEYGPLLSKATSDANAAALDKALEATIEYLKKCTVSHASKIASSCLNGIAAKCLSGRPSTVQKSIEVCLGLVEAEQSDKLIDIFTTKAFVNKVPKVAVASIDIVLQAVSLFGYKVVPPKEILKSLPPLFDSRDAKTRDKVKELVVEISRWVGAEVVKSILFEKMRDAMKEDVEKMIQEAPAGKPQAQRFTKTEQVKMRAQEALGAVGSGGGGGAGGDGVPGHSPEEDNDAMEIDDYDLADPSEVIGELNKEWWGNLQEKKWSIRKGALTSLRQLASKPKLATGDYGEINRELKKIIGKDSNVQCVAEAVACVGALAKGLRNNFSSSAKGYCPILLEKFKEKNPNVCRSCMDALIALQKYCFQLIDVQEDIIAALSHQNPKVKQNTLDWMKACIDVTNKQITSKMQPIFVPPVTKCTDDAEPATRDKALSVLVSFCIKAVSSAAIDKILQKLDEPRQKKLNEMLAEARKGSGGGSGAKPATLRAPLAAAANVSVSKTPSVLKKDPDRMQIDSPTDASANVDSSKPFGKPVAATKAKSSAPKKMPLKAVAPLPQNALIEDDTTLEGQAMPAVLAKEGFVQLFGETVVNDLASAVWKERLAALDLILEKLKELNINEHGKLVVYGISYMPGWSEKIFQVMARQFEILKYVASASSTYSRGEAYCSIKGLVEKVADVKLKGHAFETLSTICEISGMKFVFTKIHEKAATHKNPKVLAETLNWMGQALTEFGLGPWMEVQCLLNWIIADLNNTNVAVKSSATTLTGTMHRFLGPALGDLIRSSVKPAQMTNIEAEFAKNPRDTAFVATRFIKGMKSKRAGRMGGDEEANNNADDDKMDVDTDAPSFDPDDLLPRQDISERLGPLISNINSANWKERKEGMDGVEELLTSSGNRIQPNVGDLMQALKGRMADTNKNLIAQAIKLLARICEAMGKPIDKQGRSALGPMLTGLCDNKPQVRSAVIELLEAWSTATTVNSLMPEFVAAVSSAKCQPDGKKDALAWLTKKVIDGKLRRDSIENLLASAATGLTDKGVQPREAGSVLLTELKNKFGSDIISAAQSLESSVRKVILDAVQKTGDSANGPAALTASASMPSKLTKPAANSQNSMRIEEKSPGPAKRPKTIPNSKTAKLSPGPIPPSAGGSKGSTAASKEVALLQLSEEKDARARKNRGKRPAFEGVQPDEPALLKSELEPLVSPVLGKLLFSSNFQDHINAAKMIKDALSTYYQQIISCLDLLFRWCVLRIAQSNTQSLIMTLEMLKAMFEKMASESYQMSEYEAVLLIPCVVEKMGHNQDKIKKDHREIIVLSTTVYPTNKIFVFVSDGLMSKNNKTRVECAEEMGCMVDRDGIKIATGSKQTKSLSVLAKCVSERDKALRQACLGALEVMYDFEGTKIWASLGKLTDQQKSLIEERFKYREKVLEKKGNKPGYRGSRPTSPVTLSIGMQRAAIGSERAPSFQLRAQQEFLRGQRDSEAMEMQSSSSTDANINSNVQTTSSYPDPPKSTASRPQIPSFPSSPSSTATNAYATNHTVHQKTLSNINIPNLTSLSPPPATPLPMAAEPRPVPPTRSDAEIEETWSRAMITTQSEDPEEAIESLKVLCYELIEAFKGRASQTTMLLLEESANELVTELSRKMEGLFTEAIKHVVEGTDCSSNRGCKYTLNTLMQTFNITSMAKAVEKQTLLDMISCLLMLLLDDRMTRIQDGPQLMKAMNVLMMKVLDNARLNHVIGVLMFLLRAPPVKIMFQGRDLENRFMNLVVKCLIKATKQMGMRLEAGDDENGIDVKNILANIHEFFLRLGPDEIVRRGQVDDKPLRMIKTILYEICKFKGVTIGSYLGDIISENPPPIILAYIDLNLDSLKNSGQIQEPLPNFTQTSANNVVISQYFVSIDQLSSRSQGYPNPDSPSPDTSIGTVTPPPLEGTRPESTSNDLLKTELASIFKKIGDKSTSRAGMEELYNFQFSHPEVDMQPFLSATSEAFRSYIDRGLQRIQERNAEYAATAVENTMSQSQSGMEVDGEDQEISFMPHRSQQLSGNSGYSPSLAATARNFGRSGRDGGGSQMQSLPQSCTLCPK